MRHIFDGKQFNYCEMMMVCFRLRLGRLNEEMKESDVCIASDNLFNDVVRDFSQLACLYPEKLQRSVSSTVNDNNKEKDEEGRNLDRKSE